MHVKQSNHVPFQQAEQIRTKRPSRRHITQERSTGGWLQTCGTDDRNQRPYKCLTQRTEIPPIYERAQGSHRNHLKEESGDGLQKEHHAALAPSRGPCSGQSDARVLLKRRSVAVQKSRRRNGASFRLRRRDVWKIAACPRGTWSTVTGPREPTNLALPYPGSPRGEGAGSMERQRLSLISFMPAHLQRYELRRFQRAAVWQQGRLFRRTCLLKDEGEGHV